MEKQQTAVVRPPSMVDAERLGSFVAKLFKATGLTDKAAKRIAESLIEADLAGQGSHGVMQAEVYLARLKRGSVSTGETAEVVVDRDAIAVLDSHHILGHFAADQAMALAVEKAKKFGLGAVAVRHAFHFGIAGRYTRYAAQHGCIGFAMANTRPTMPAPGGAQKLVGTNPLSIAAPTPQEPHLVFDMATSAGTVGRMRLAAKAGKPLPDGWAVTESGEPTNDPEAGLAGMLLPTGGAKGFGLSLMIDVMCGMLASGAWGDKVPGLHIDLNKPSDSSHFFMAIDIGHFRPLAEFLDESGAAAARVRNSRKAPGVDRVFTPGERKWDNARKSGGKVKLEAAQIDALSRLAEELGVDAAELKALT